MRIRNLIRRLGDDPLLKFGLSAMAIALGVALVVAVAAFLDEPKRAVAAKSPKEAATKPLVRSDPGIDPWVEKDIPPPKPAPEPKTVPAPEPVSQPDASQPEPPAQPKEEQHSSAPQDERSGSLPLDEKDYPLPTHKQLEAAKSPRHYHLPSGAIMGLTIKALGLHNVPVLNSDSRWALDEGVIHLPDTSLPWSHTPERNVYLAGHRLGWPGTGSHLVFFRLGSLEKGDKITLRDREGRRYDYRVIESFTIDPEESWVTGRVRGRDLLTLQTCTPIPTFDKRLIVRAERV